VKINSGVINMSNIEHEDLMDNPWMMFWIQLAIIATLSFIGSLIAYCTYTTFIAPCKTPDELQMQLQQQLEAKRIKRQ
jgi:hypothetical protein